MIKSRNVFGMKCSPKDRTPMEIKKSKLVLLDSLIKTIKQQYNVDCCFTMSKTSHSVYIYVFHKNTTETIRISDHKQYPSPRYEIIDKKFKNKTIKQIKNIIFSIITS